jgi:hypothetical protein
MTDARAAGELALRARDHHARHVFDLRKVARAIGERATGGYRDLRLAQQLPFDLSRTAPAQRLEDWLEAHQFRYGWYPTLPLADPLRGAHTEDYPELAIFW